MPRARVGPGFDHVNANGGVNAWGADLSWRTYVGIINMLLKGDRPKDIARHPAIQVSLRTVYRVRARFAGTARGHAPGDFMTLRRGGRDSAQPLMQLPQLLFLRYLYNLKNDLFLWEYKHRFKQDLGVDVSLSTIGRALQLLRLTRKARPVSLFPPALLSVSRFRAARARRCVRVCVCARAGADAAACGHAWARR
jgi:hypothetical protein